MQALIAVLLFEAALRIHNPAGLRLRGDRILLPARATFHITNPDDPRLDRVVVQHRNALGFRGPEVPVDFASRLSIVTVGGSTTECLRLPDDRTWPAVMESILARARPDVWVNNAGLSGHSTVGHQVLFDSYLRQLHPRVVVYLTGANDVGNPVANPFFGWRARLAKYSEVANLLWNIEGLWRARHLRFDGHGIDPLTAETRLSSESEIAAAMAKDAPSLDGYRVRLTTLVERTRAAGIEPILATQPLLGGNVNDPATGASLATIWDPGDELNGAGTWRMLERYNDVTRALAASHGVALVDLARTLPKDSRLFIDLIHFSNDGAAAVGRLMAAALAARFQAEGGV